jgi:hypothetical protein
MTDVTYTLTVRQTEPYRFEVTIPEIGVTVTGTTFGSATLEAHRAIEKHHRVRFLVLVMRDEHVDDEGGLIEPRKRLQAAVMIAAIEVVQQGIAERLTSSEHRLVFQLSAPLTPAQMEWLRSNEGTLFDEFHFLDEAMIEER